ncbi:hypothetical protein LEAN103870_09990 [Legionella anisa]|uniref:Uncharacterized protein n=1 Tax=Legionella anisa TaxID=28082 RepID=A0AAX0WXP1_9GAMM|nr:hypothetical protein [Legionella anisa]AWN74435.1 hypothetical protein DLD14_11550 [Legionella anisa]KTC71881.1 hypothetical protein Lani_1473 [Legionella anisa]MBN5935413.1 hypothetical protein [Legionella anisa]MCW8425466.1 hypothetical protein [Legionella anisa]MCW8449103.1 hypothetical protein [Legionella anisa]
MKIAVILPNVEYTNLPFGRLHQLDKVGISNIIILLSDDELRKAQATQFVVFDDTAPQTVIEHYQSQSDRLKIEVINTGTATTEEEKLIYYLKYAEGQYKLNLFLCKKSIPWVSEELSAKPPVIKTTEYSFIPFFKSTDRKSLPLFQPPCSSEQAIKLLQHDLNPCICYKMANFDVLHYQWLFNIFVELISLKIKLHEDKNTKFLPQLNKLIKDFNKNIIDLEKAEIAFEKSHKKAHFTLDEPDVITRWQHDKNVKKRMSLDENLPKLIGKLIKLHEKLVLQENLNLLDKTDEIVTEDDLAQKDFIERIEGKPFG